MATSQLPQLGANADFNQVKSTMIQWQDYFNWFFRNLDSLNIKSLTAEKIKAGKMVGFVIQTNEDGQYPNIIFTSATNLIQAFSDADNHVDMDTAAGTSPGLAWYVAGALAAYLQTGSFGTLLTTFGSGKSITLQPAKDLNLSVGSGGDLTIGSPVAQIGQSGTVYVSATPGGVANIPITFTKGIRTT